MRRILLALCLVAAPALGQGLGQGLGQESGQGSAQGFDQGLDEKPVSPAEFRAFAEGWTLHFERDGEPFGQEAFEPGGNTLWRYPDGSCMEGVWAPHGAQLCFYYGEGAEVLCWRALRDAAGLKVRLLGDGPDAGLELRITGRDREPPLCGAPGRGV